MTEKKSRKIKKIKKCRELLETKIGDWVSIPVHSEEQRIGLVFNIDNSSNERIRGIALREEVGRIRIINYWIYEGINPRISSISYMTYSETDKEFAKYDVMLLEAEIR